MKTASASVPAYVWQVEGKPVGVAVSVEVVERISEAVSDGYKANPWRGMEVGGLLLGRNRTAGRAAFVEVCDFEPVESEHAAGPSFLLSDPDRHELEKQLARKRPGLLVVGMYRSDTRREYGLEVEDITLFSHYFGKPWNVFLLIRARKNQPLTAGFLTWEAGKIRTMVPYQEFPFDRQTLEAEETLSAVAVPAEDAAAAVAAALEPVAEQRVPAKKPRDRAAGHQDAPAAPPGSPRELAGERPTAPDFKRKPLRILPRAAWAWAATGTAVAGLLAMGALSRPEKRPGAEAAGLDVTLRVARQEGSLRLMWEGAAGLSRADRAVLTIEDGGVRQAIPLDLERLREGGFAYVPKSGDVTFRMEFFAGRRSTTESVRAVGFAPAQVAAAAATEPRKEEGAERSTPMPKGETRDRETATAEAVPPSAPAPAPRARTEPAVGVRRISPRAFEAPGATRGFARGDGSSATLLPEPPAAASIGVNTAALPEIAARPFCHVTQLPARQSRASRAFGRIPVLGRFAKRAEYVPPTPLGDLVPAVPPDVRRRVSKDEDVDVRVVVGASGSVQQAEVLSKGTDRALEQLVLYAAETVAFSPAIEGGTEVPGELVLRYHFAPDPRGPR